MKDISRKAPPKSFFFYFIFFLFFSDFDLQYCPWSCPLALVARTTCYRDVLKMMQSVGTGEMVAWKCFFITDQSAYATKTCIHSGIIFFFFSLFFLFSKGIFLSAFRFICSYLLCVCNSNSSSFTFVVCLFFPFHKDSISVTATPQRNPGFALVSVLTPNSRHQSALECLMSFKFFYFGMALCLLF